MAFVKKIVGSVGPLVAACLILAPSARFCGQAETQVSLRRVECVRPGDVSHVAFRPGHSLTRWCELAGCKAGETRAELNMRHDRSQQTGAGGLVSTGSSRAIELGCESIAPASWTIAIHSRARILLLSTRLQI